MPAKKATSQKAAAPAPAASSSNAEWAKWVYLGGVIVAGLLGAFGGALNLGADVSKYIAWILMLAGILAGIFFLDSGDVVNFGIRYLLLFAVARSLDGFLAFGNFSLGAYLSGFFSGVLGFFGPVGLTLLFMYFWKKYFSSTA